MANGIKDDAFETRRKEYLNCFCEFRNIENALEVAKHKTPDFTELLPDYFDLLGEKKKLENNLNKYENMFEKAYGLKIERSGKYIRNIKDLTSAEKTILAASQQKTPEIIISPQLQQPIY